MTFPCRPWSSLGNTVRYQTHSGSAGSVDFAEAVTGCQNPELDPVAVVEYLSYGFFLDDRTLVKELKRTPWMHRPDEDGGWSPCRLPESGRQKPRADTVATKLKHLLLDECRSYVEGARHVGILLSGGMDSRIVASSLWDVWRESGQSFAVTAFTWGLPGTRDVLYAQQIAESLGWQWRHLPLSAEVLQHNIRVAGQSGCEVAAVHLHAMADVVADEPFDGVMAGTFGDMVGRGEASGKRLNDLKPMDRQPVDPFCIVRGGLLDEARDGIASDLNAKAKAWPERTGVAHLENEQHMHYLRRKLHAVMGAMLSPVPLWQMFSHPDIYSLMWSLDPEIRDDRYYAILSSEQDDVFGNIPWARTGRVFQSSGKSSPADTASCQHHAYGKWLRTELCAEVSQRVLSERVLGTGIFNESALHRLLGAWRLGRTKTIGPIDETIAWLASFDVFLETYPVRMSKSVPSIISDVGRGWKGTLKAHAFTQVRSLLRD